MTREEWLKGSHAVRKLLYRLNNENRPTMLREYAYGLRYNPNYDFYHLVDGISSQTTATISFRENTLVRYNPKWRYSFIPANWKSDVGKTRHVTSTNVSNRDTWGSVQSLVRRCQEARATHYRTDSQRRYQAACHTASGGVAHFTVMVNSDEEQAEAQRMLEDILPRYAHLLPQEMTLDVLRRLHRSLMDFGVIVASDDVPVQGFSTVAAPSWVQSTTAGLTLSSHWSESVLREMTSPYDINTLQDITRPRRRS